MSWYEVVSDEDIDCGNYEDGEKGFDNYPEAINLYNELKAKKIYNVSLKKCTFATLE